MPKSAPPAPTGWIRRLFEISWRNPGLVVVVVVSSVLGTGLEAVGPLITRVGVNDAVAGQTSEIGLLITVLIVLAAIRFLAAYLRRYLAGKLALG
ncbi:MAG TPA: hypothetical protein VHZ97_15130, partial [Pseudonocardiaceae bacterium]|nr:hypothetical protein [Pseudonocardiaceae bacterium]